MMRGIVGTSLKYPRIVLAIAAGDVPHVTIAC